MPNRLAAAALAALLTAGGCSEVTIAPAGLCVHAVQAQGTIFVLDVSATATAAEAGALFAVVQRERNECIHGMPVTVTDSTPPPPPREPWVDGDAFGIPAGTRLYERVGPEPGQQLVAEISPGTWWLLHRSHRA